MSRGGRAGVVFVAAVATVAACEKSDAIVVVTVAADQDVAGVVRLRAVVSNGGTGATRTFPARAAAAAGDIAFPTTFSLTVPRDRTGALDIALEGLDGGDVVIANGADTVDLRGGDNVAVTIALHAGATTCGNGQLDAGEDCDDGDRVSGGSCDFLCRTLGAGTGNGGMGGSAGGGGMGGSAGGACASELLTNGNFDGTSGWTANDPTGRPLIYDQTGLNPAQAPQAQSPPNMAWLGYNVHDSTITLRQSVMVPANAVTLTVSGFRLIRTDEDSQSVYDTANLALDRGASRLDLRPQPWSNLDRSNAWLDFTYTVDATPYAGTTATFVIHVEMDDDVNTSFFFDTLSVVADLCP
jgi:cysteine-rich repeat protein